MNTSRREFVGHVAVGAMMLGGLPRSLEAATRALDPSASTAPEGEWDVSWPRKLTGTHRAVFDVPEIESGYGVWRATVWSRQYQAVLQTPASELSTALILRHNGIALAMRQEFWDRYDVGRRKGVTHPITLEPTDRNPALLTTARGEIPEQFAGVSLPELLERGGVALACDLALQDCVALIESTDGVSPEAARKQALEYLVPGVILQPSGVFAAVLAQDAARCAYVRAS